MKETNLTFWTCLFKGTISSTVDFEPGGGIKEEAIYTKYLSSSSKRVVLCDVNFFKLDADELQISPKQTLCFSNEFVSSMVCSRLIYKKKENNSRVSKVRPSSFSSSPFFLSDSLSAREKERREGLMRYKSQIFPLTYTSRAFVVFINYVFQKNVLTTTKGAKKNPLALKPTTRESQRESAQSPLCLSLSWDASKALLRARASASVCRLAHGGEKRGQSVIQFFFFEIIKERVKNTRTNERKRSFFY